MAAKSLFTDNIPDDLKDIVRRIPDGSTDQFRSAPTTYDQGGKGWVSYDVAWKNPDTNLWTIEAHKSFLNDGELDVSNKKTVMRNVCFFDALYHCGFSQIARVKGGEKEFDDQERDIPHYLDAAAAAGQPLDVAGLPHPAAHGRILTDGSFDSEAVQVAKETKSTELAPLSSRQSDMLSGTMRDALSCVDVSSSQTGMGGAQAMVARRAADASLLQSEVKSLAGITADKVKATKDYRGPVESISTLASDAAVDYRALGFPLGGSALLSGVSAIGAMFVFGLPADMGAWTWETARTGILSTAIIAPASVPFWEKVGDAATSLGRRSCFRKMDKALCQMPESDVKTALHEFRVASEANYHFMRTARIAGGKTPSNRIALKRAFSHVAKAAKMLDLSDMEQEKLRGMVLNGTFPEPRTFESQIYDQYRRFSHAFENASEDDFVAPASSPKALEHKPELPADTILATSKQKMPEPE